MVPEQLMNLQSYKQCLRLSNTAFNLCQSDKDKLVSNCVFFLFYFLFIYLTAPSFSCGMWNLLPWPGIEPRHPALERQSLSHWTTMEVPNCAFDLHFSDYYMSQKFFQIFWSYISFSRVSSRPRDWTWVSYIADGFFTNWAIRKPTL